VQHRDKIFTDGKLSQVVYVPGKSEVHCVACIAGRLEEVIVLIAVVWRKYWEVREVVRDGVRLTP